MNMLLLLLIIVLLYIFILHQAWLTCFRITLGITKDGMVTVTNQEVPVCVNVYSIQEMTQVNLDQVINYL